MALPTVALVSVGGTIAALGRDRLDLAGYLAHGVALDPARLLADLPEAAGLADVRHVPFPAKASHALVDEDWLALREALREALDDDDVRGAVVLHGTNTLEETAYFLSLTLPADKPVVVVGAMRPASGLGADGPINLLNALRVAVEPRSAGRGVLVVMNDTVYAPRDVTKGLTYRVHAFHSPDLGPLGFADADGRVVYYHRAERRPERPLFRLGEGRLPRVDVVVSYVGADGALVDAAVAAGAAGVVSAGTGAGWPTPAELEALRRARDRGVVVCQSTRVAGGRVTENRAAEREGFVLADNLGPFKARVLLALALTLTSDPREVQRLFDRC